MYKFLLCLLAVLGGISASHAQGINCGHARTQVEIQICQSQPLMALDRELNKWYARARASQVNRHDFDKAHQEWLKERNACDTETCLINIYKTYNANLRTYPLFTPVEGDAPIARTHNDLGRLSGTAFAVKEHRWEVKPFFDRYSYLRLIETLKGISPKLGQNPVPLGVVAAIDTNEQFYLYLQFNDYSAGTLPFTSIVVQLAENGDIKIVSVSSAETGGRNCPETSESYQSNFSVDGDGLAFTTMENCLAVRKRWSIKAEQLSSLTEKEVSRRSESNARDINWNGQCGDVSCYGHRAGPAEPFLAFHGEASNSDARQSQQYTEFGGPISGVYPDRLFLVTDENKVINIIGPNSTNRDDWYLTMSNQHCSRANCYFVNEFGDYGLWTIDFQKRELTRILPVKYLEWVYPYSTKKSNYFFYKNNMGVYPIYIARENAE